MRSSTRRLAQAIDLEPEVMGMSLLTRTVDVIVLDVVTHDGRGTGGRWGSWKEMASVRCLRRPDARSGESAVVWGHCQQVPRDGVPTETHRT